jgi:hypothetical protein
VRLLIHIGISLSLCSLLACDPGHTIKFTVENNSTKQLVLSSVYFDDNGGDIILPPNSSTSSDRSDLGGYQYVKSREYCPCSDPAIKLIASDSMIKITKDITDPSNWLRTEKRKYFMGGEFTCKFSIGDTDLQK